MGKITGWRADQGESEIDRLRNENKKRLMDEYGRSDIPSYVQRAAESYALRKRVSNKQGLEALIKESGSFALLVSTLSKERNRLDKKHRKQRQKSDDQKKKPQTHPSQLQKAIDASKGTKYASIVLGGAPGLGKKS